MIETSFFPEEEMLSGKVVVHASLGNSSKGNRMSPSELGEFHVISVELENGQEVSLQRFIDHENLLRMASDGGEDPLDKETWTNSLELQARNPSMY